MIIQLYQQADPKTPIIASDGLLHVDGRLNRQNILLAIEERNRKFKKHFPHKMAAAKFTIFKK